MNRIGAGPLMHLGTQFKHCWEHRAFHFAPWNHQIKFFAVRMTQKPEAITCFIGIRSVKVFSDENGKFNKNK